MPKYFLANLDLDFTEGLVGLDKFKMRVGQL